MTASQTPRVLVVTSTGASKGAVMPVLAALEAAGLKVRAIDVGRAGARAEGTLDWVVQAFTSELAERRLLREMNEQPPDVTVAFDPNVATAMSVARDQAARPAPVIAVVNELAPVAEWAGADADRYLTIDDEAAVALADHGVEAERIVTVGPVCERAFVEAAAQQRKALRERFRMNGTAKVVVVEVAGCGYDLSSQIALQLSLMSKNTLFLFDAGSDVEAATALRRQVPTLELRAKLFGKTEDAALLWRCADIAVARPTDTAAARAMVLGAALVAFLPDDLDGQAVARAMELRKLGATAQNALLLSSALEPLLRGGAATHDLVGVDGAATIADIAWIVGAERREILEERRRTERAGTRARVQAATEAAEAAARVASAAGGLEDLSEDNAGFAGTDVPDKRQIAQLRAEVRTRMSQVTKTVTEAREAAERWDRRLEQARTAGEDGLIREAERQSDAERARMHAALAEMAQLQSELDRLEKAAAEAPPPRPSQGSGTRWPGASASSQSDATFVSGTGPSQSIDDMIADMKRKTAHKDVSIDDELAALKRRMKKKP